MKYKVYVKLLSSAIKIQTESQEFTLKHKLFSYNAELRDSSNIVAHTKRASWWNMKFILSVDSSEYELDLGLSGAVLSMSGEEIARSIGWNKLYSNNKAIAEFDEPKALLKPSCYSLNIASGEHETALMITSCLNLKRHHIDQ